MAYQPDFPDILKELEFVQLFLRLRVQDGFTLPPWGMLQLRRELQQAGRLLSDRGHPAAPAANALLKPRLPDDPVLLRQVQQPPPAVVFQPDPRLQGTIADGQLIELPVLLCGAGLQAFWALLALIEEWGRLGVFNGAGRFVPEQIKVLDAAGRRRRYWEHGGPRPTELPPMTDAAWWLEQQPGIDEFLIVEVLTPLRLMRHGKPLFRASFEDLWPFLLRRVQTVLKVHADVDLLGETRYLLDRGMQLGQNCGQLRWQDWRVLRGPTRMQPVGGLLGCLTLPSEELHDLIWVLQLGTLLNLGKGASYGAGRYCLKSS